MMPGAMPVELECKIPIGDFGAVRAALTASGAEARGGVLEVNRLFDDDRRTLSTAGCGLRVRVVRPLAGEGVVRPGQVESPRRPAMLTFKGPVQSAAFKKREEVELEIDDAEAMVRLLAGLGYAPWLTFEKRRETWRLGGCTVELDEAPRIGRFVEVEGETEEAIHRVLAQLRLDGKQSMTQSYAGLIAEHLRGQGVLPPWELRF